MIKKITYIILVFTLILTNCSVFSKPPLSVFNSFMKACNANDLATAETYLSENAIQALEASKFDACMNYMPDGTRRALGVSLWSDEEYIPEVVINGNTAYLNFTTSHWAGPIVVTMYKTNGKWRIEQTIYY